MLGVNKEIIEARSQIMNIVANYVSKEGLGFKRRSSYIDFYAQHLDTIKTFQVLDKDYRYMHCFELHCGINWLNIWRIVWIDDPLTKENMFKDMALIGLNSAGDPEFGDIQYRSIDEVDKVSNIIIRYYNERVVPFFEKWYDYHNVEEEFFTLSDAAVKVSLFRRRASRIAIAIALVGGDRRLAERLIEEHGLCFESEPSELRKMEQFVGTLRARGLIYQQEGR